MITSVDNLVSSISSGKIHRSDWFYKKTVVSGTTTQVSIGIDLSASPGQFGGGNQFPGTALTWVTCNDAAGNGTQIFGIPHGGNVSPDKKHLISASAIHPPVSNTAAGAPAAGGNLVLVDLQGYWPGIAHNTTSGQTLLGTPSLRYDNGNGCRLYNVVTTGLGATAHNITISYQNQSNNTSNTGAIPARLSSTVGQLGNVIATSNSSLYFPLVNGDIGVQNVNTVTMSAVSSGVSALCLARPLIHVPLVAGQYTVNEKEFVYQTPSMPEIKDGACLVWLYFVPVGASSTSVGGAAANYGGHIETVWG